MARKFLYLVAALTVLVIAGLLALRVAGDSLSRIAFVPTTEFVEQDALAANAYADPAMWLSRPRMAAAADSARWQPPGTPATDTAAPFAVFFVHPTSYLDKARWNAPLGDAEA